jgi:hypothetical protein
VRQANERRGDDHGGNLTHLRAVGKRLKVQLDAMVGEIQSPKLLDSFIVNVVKFTR